MEIEEPITDHISTPLIEESEVIENDLNEEDKISLDKTIQVENSTLKSKDNEKETSDVTSNQENSSENGKKKVKEEKPPSKIVVRRLPPTMTKDQFLEQVSPLPEVDYLYYVHGDVNNSINPFSRAYLNFVNQDDLFSFSRTFDNYVFLDAKGQEYPAVVEFAMFQRVPKQRLKKKDPLIGTIESDPAFITFKENLLAEALENSKPGGKAIKQHYFETEISATEEVNTTPLLEFLKVRRAEKARIREERREEKKRKEVERKLKQKTKDKKADGEEEEVPKDVKVLPSKERRDTKDRDSRNAKKKEEKDRLKESRVREFKSRGGKSYQEERLKLAERREELKKKEQQTPSEKSTDAVDTNEVSENADPSAQQVKNSDEKPVRVEKKRYENRKGNKYDNEDWKGDSKKRNRGDRNSKRDDRDRKDEYSRRNSERKGGEPDSRRKHKGYRDSRPEKKKSAPNNDQEVQEPKQAVANQTVTQEENDITERKTRSYDDLTVISNNGENKAPEDNETKDQSESKKRCSSLESGRSENNTSKNELLDEVEKIVLQKKEKHSKSSRQSEPSSSFRSRKDLSNKKSSSEDKNGSSKKKEKSDNSEEGKVKEDQQSKNSSQESSAGGDNSGNKSKESTSRAERRIRNKDRPSIEIYRPGMGKFSKQRLEKEKALGSSTEVESPSHSPSPTPKSKLIT